MTKNLQRLNNKSAKTIIISVVFGLVCLIFPFLRVTPVIWRSNEQWGYYLFYYTGVEYWGTDPDIIPPQPVLEDFTNYSTFALRPGHAILDLLGWLILFLGLVLLVMYVSVDFLEKWPVSQKGFKIVQVVFVGTFILHYVSFIQLLIDLASKATLLNIPLLIIQILAIFFIVYTSRKT